MGTEPHLDYKDSVSTISMIESQKLGFMSQASTPLQRNQQSLYESPRGKAERVAMRSSFAVGVSKFEALVNERNCSIQLYLMFEKNGPCFNVPKW